jgi:asparagine synthase (glutamine-hydrolysing)
MHPSAPMCGFAGIYAPDCRPIQRDSIRRMLDSLRHRGPDGEGYRFDAGLGLGFCRLAIVDVAGGAQPLSDETGRIWLVCNGEIYNYRELATELSGMGHHFRSRSDSEVIVHG